MRCFKAILLVSTVILFTGCEDPDSMKSKDVIFISHEVPTGTCQDPDFQSAFGSGVDNPLFRVEDSSVTCETFEKINGEDCEVNYFDSGTETCVFGFDIFIPEFRSRNIDDVSVIINGY